MILILILVSLVLGSAATTGYFVYKAHQKSVNAAYGPDYNPDALMTVTSSGGLCASACNYPTYNLYENGKFEGYKRLSGSEVSKLKDIIKDTDFTRYGPNPHPKCESFYDGSDQVLLFPRKYGGKTFTTCMMDIPDHDPAFGYIDRLLESHYVQKN